MKTLFKKKQCSTWVNVFMECLDKNYHWIAEKIRKQAKADDLADRSTACHGTLRRNCSSE